MDASLWTIDDRHAQLQSTSLTAQLQLLSPHSGLRNVCPNHAELELQLLGVQLPESDSTVSIEDAYARVDDLVVTYAETPQWKLRSQIYWRYARQYAQACGIEVVASLQTSLLDAPAAIDVSSRIAADEVLALSHNHLAFIELARSSRPHHLTKSTTCGCFVFRLAGANLSYVEMVHPGDFHESSIEAVADLHVEDPATISRHRLFGRRLEKGVILRGRVLGLFVPQDDDLRLVKQYYQVFAQSKPVLTA
jgi:hypothetical protein